METSMFTTTRLEPKSTMTYEFPSFVGEVLMLEYEIALSESAAL